MRKLFLTVLLASAATPAFSALTQLEGSKFSDPNGKAPIVFPCTGGGEPLVIYSAPLNNKKSISSQTPVYPIYTHRGYIASPLTVGDGAHSDISSVDHFIIKSPNPASIYHYVTFSLKRANNADFYVNTVNFAAIDSSSDDWFVSAYKIIINGTTLLHSDAPARMFSSDQDWGALVEQSVKTIQGFQYSWNEKSPWVDNDNPSPTYPVAYNFGIRPSEEAGIYDGYGFWICGSDHADQTQKPKGTYFFDGRETEKN